MSSSTASGKWEHRLDRPGGQGELGEQEGGEHGAGGSDVTGGADGRRLRMAQTSVGWRAGAARLRAWEMLSRGLQKCPGPGGFRARGVLHRSPTGRGVSDLKVFPAGAVARKQKSLVLDLDRPCAGGERRPQQIPGWMVTLARGGPGALSVVRPSTFPAFGWQPDRRPWQHNAQGSSVNPRPVCQQRACALCRRSSCAGAGVLKSQTIGQSARRNSDAAGAALGAR